MLKRITRFALIAAAATSVAHADLVTVTFSAQNSGGGLGTSSGVDLPTGSLVRLGYFDVDDATILAMQGDVGLLDEFFTVIAEVMVGFFGGETMLDDAGMVTDHDPGTSFSVDGGFAHSVTFDPVPLQRDGDRLVLWAFNSDVIATATEFGIFADSDWETPASLTFSADLSTVDPEKDLYVGNKGPEQAEAIGGELNKLVPIPEPSAALLMLLGMARLALRRRRGAGH